MKVLITGAHFTPAVAVIEELKKQNVDIVYVGRGTTLEGDPTKSQESQLLPELEVKFIPIITGRLQRQFSIFTILSLIKIPIGFIQSTIIILTQKPDVILSFGGYVSVPVIIVGWLWSIPIVLHEQTLVSGLANRICAIFADKICVGFKENYFSRNRRTIFTGNPIRGEITNPKGVLNEQVLSFVNEDFKNLFKTAKENNLPVILITGGNQGSHTINLAVEDCLEKLLKITCVIHQTGDSRFNDFEKLILKKSDRFLPIKFIGDEIGLVLSRVDLVVSRAGANTLTELAFFKKPTLVIPLPHLYQDEQNKNAKFFQDLGLVEILSQSKLNGNSLLYNIKLMIRNIDNLKKRAKGSESIIVKDSAKRLALEVSLTYKKSVV